MNASQASADFRYYLRVRYAECDAQKVVFNARYGEYVDLAVTEYFRSLGFEAALDDGSLDYQLVRQTLEWRRPARFDQVLEVQVRSLHLGTTSFTLGCRFFLAGTADLLASAETVYVLVDTQLQKRPLPAELRSALTKGAQGAVVDHAGFRRDQD